MATKLVDRTKIKIKFIIAIVLLVIALTISGCVEKQTESRYIQVTPQPTAKQEPELIYRISSNSGNYNINANVVTIDGSYNNIRILNNDLRKIIVNGSYNNIAYSVYSNAEVINSGRNNNIGAYENPQSVSQTQT